MTRTDRAPLRRNVERSRARLAKLARGQLPEVLYTFTFDVRRNVHLPVVSGYELVPADAGNLEQLRRLHPGAFDERKHSILRDRLARPDLRCLVIADAHGTPCGYCHMAFGDQLNERINHLVRVAPSQSYFFDDYVFKKHRGKGLHTLAIVKRLQIAAEMGITEGLTIISRSNRRSIASYGKVGLRRVEVLVHLPPLRATLSLRNDRFVRRSKR